MDETIRESLSNFHSLWQRVTGNKPPSDQAAEEKSNLHFQPEQTLRSFIQAEHCAITFNRTLAKMLQGNSRLVLLTQAEDARRRVRRLRAEYFICTGINCMPKNNCPSVTGRLTALRTAMIREEQLAESYAHAAQTASPAQKSLYENFAEGSAFHARTLRSILISSFT